MDFSIFIDFDACVWGGGMGEGVRVFEVEDHV